jgi:hypothetical protein
MGSTAPALPFEEYLAKNFCLDDNGSSISLSAFLRYGFTTVGGGCAAVADADWGMGDIIFFL